MTIRWLPHTADVRAELTGRSLPDLLGQACQAVRELLVGQSPVRSGDGRALSVTGTDETELVLAFCRALFDLYDRDQFVPAHVDVPEPARAAGGLSVTAVLYGETFNGTRHEPQPEVKAVTRHGLRVTHTDAGWMADIVFDV